MTEPTGWRKDGPKDENQKNPEWWENAIAGSGPLDHPDFDDDEEPPEHFVPQDPGPLPYISPPTVLGTVALLAGFWAILWPDYLAEWLFISSDFVMVLGVVSMLAGAVTLVGRLRNPDPDEETDDDGSRV
ncbi:MAG: DUF308 domain-containing protein [Corynebacteriales bacterium]|nr:DUF308 domain-containing protein [Mycobacteriales bacterium]